MAEPTTNVERLKNAAAALRDRGLPGDQHAARMLELCEPIATYWAEPYAAPFVPLLEAALRLAKAVAARPLAGYKLAADVDFGHQPWPTVEHLPCGGSVWGQFMEDADDVDLATLLRVVAAHRCELTDVGSEPS